MRSEVSDNLSAMIREKVFELGFQVYGIARARKLAEREPVIDSWLAAGMNDKMEYLKKNLEKRINPEVLFPGAKSLIVTGLSYNSDIKQKHPGVPLLSRYTYGRDYHKAIIPKLRKLLRFIQSIDPEAEGKALCDSGPITEKGWAVEAGLGWQGRHSVLINKEFGSFLFLGILILNIELDYSDPFRANYCGDCRLCIDACPTAAINSNGTIDARRCIANITIENRGPIPPEFIPRLGRRVYGCDRCQEVCPWNKKAEKDLTPEFEINPEVAEMTPDDWQALSREEFTRLFKNTAVERVRYEDFVRNIRDVMKS